VTETPTMHRVMAQNLVMALRKYYSGVRGGQGGGRSGFDIPLLILCAEKYPKITQSGLAAVVRHLPLPPYGPPHPWQLESMGDISAAAVPDVCLDLSVGQRSV